MWRAHWNLIGRILKIALQLLLLHFLHCEEQLMMNQKSTCLASILRRLLLLFLLIPLGFKSLSLKDEVQAKSTLSVAQCYLDIAKLSSWNMCFPNLIAQLFLNLSFCQIRFALEFLEILMFLDWEAFSYTLELCLHFKRLNFALFLRLLVLVQKNSTYSILHLF